MDGAAIGGAALAKLAGRAGEDVEVSASHEASGAVCGLSFAASTLVATPSGERPIASLKVGDQVLAVDPKTGKATTQTVQQVFLNHDTDLLNVTLRTTAKPTQHATTSPAVDPAYKQRMAAVASHGSHAPPSSATTTLPGDETIHTTANHPWLSADRGWIVAGHLSLGEPVQRVDGSVAVVVALTPVHGSAPMWDLTVSKVHDFAVGTGAYVVHNCNRPVNARGEPYPKATDPRTNKPVPFPEGDLKIVPKESRVEWDSPATGFKRRGAYIKEWFDRKLPKLPGSWGDYELHHIWPREYGGN